MQSFINFLKAHCQSTPQSWDGDKYIIIDDGELDQKVNFNDLLNIYLNHETPYYSVIRGENTIDSIQNTFILCGFNRLSNQLDICFNYDWENTIGKCTTGDLYDFLVVFSTLDDSKSFIIENDDNGLAESILNSGWQSLLKSISEYCADINYIENRHYSSKGINAYKEFCS